MLAGASYVVSRRELTPVAQQQALEIRLQRIPLQLPLLRPKRLLRVRRLLRLLRLNLPLRLNLLRLRLIRK